MNSLRGSFAGLPPQMHLNWVSMLDTLMQHCILAFLVVSPVCGNKLEDLGEGKDRHLQYMSHLKGLLTNTS